MAEPILIWLVFTCNRLRSNRHHHPQNRDRPVPSRLGVAHHEARDWTHDPVRRGSALDSNAGRLP